VLLATLGPVTAARAAVWSDDLALARAGLAVAPGSPVLWAHLGAAQLQRMQQAAPDTALSWGEQALASFEHALVLDEANPLPHVNRFITLRLLGRAEEAQIAARQLSQRWPDDALVLHNLGVWHQAEGRHEEAVRAFIEELATGHGHPDAAAMLEESRRALLAAQAAAQKVSSDGATPPTDGETPGAPDR